MNTFVFNYFAMTNVKKFRGQAFYFEDGTYAFKSEVGDIYEGIDSLRVKTTIITKDLKENTYTGSSEYDKLLESYNISNDVAREYYIDSIGEAVVNQRNYSISSTNTIIPNQYYKKLNYILSNTKYNDKDNSPANNMYKLANAFYVLQSGLANHLQLKKSVVSNSHGIININKNFKDLYNNKDKFKHFN